MRLADLFEDQFLPCRLSLASPQTVYQYRLNLRRFEEFLKRAPTLDDLTDANLGQACAWLQRVKHLSAATASKLRENLCTVWKFANRRRLVDTWPELPQIRVPTRVPRALTRDELNRLWRYVERLPGELDGVPANLWFQSLVAVMFFTGERIGALVQTEWSQVDLHGGWIVVRAEQRKGRLSDRLYELGDQALEALRQASAPPRKLVWPWPYYPTYLWQQWKGILRRAGVPELGFHAVRKSHASYLEAAGGDAQRSLGHRDAATTGIYLDPRIVGGESPVKRLWRLGDAG